MFIWNKVITGTWDTAVRSITKVIFVSFVLMKSAHFPFVLQVLILYTLVPSRLFAGAQQVQLAGRSVEECNALCIFGRAV